MAGQVKREFNRAIKLHLPGSRATLVYPARNATSALTFFCRHCGAGATSQ